MATQFELTQQVQKQLMSNETILWTGTPKPGIKLQSSDAFAIPFSLLWCGFAVFWEFTAATSGAPPFFLLFGGAFVLIGLYIVFGRFIVDAWRRNKSVYAVSSDRVLILREFPTQKVVSLDLKQLPQMTLSTKSDNSGTITFGQEGSGSFWGRGTNWPGYGGNRAPAFEMIPDAQKVFSIIRDAQSARQHA